MVEYMKFSREELQDMAEGDSEYLIQLVEKTTGTGRWSVHYSCIFQDTRSSKFYETTYSRRATEPDERPYEYSKDEIECVEVHKVQKFVEVWEKVGTDKL